MPPSRDDESEVIEQAELTAVFYQALLAKGVGFKAAQQFTVAWILARAKSKPDLLERLRED